MDMDRKLAIICSLVLVLCAVSKAQVAQWWEVWADTHADMVCSTHGLNCADDDYNSDLYNTGTVWSRCSCGSTPPADAYAEASAKRTTNGVSIHEKETTTKGHVDSLHASADAGGISIWKIIGDLEFVIAALKVGEARLSIGAADAGRTVGISLDCACAEGSSLAGTATLDHEGNLSATGIYEDNFNVSWDDVNNAYVAEYDGPESFEVTLPVGTEFELTFDIDSEEDPNDPNFVYRLASQQVELLLPEGYELIVETPTVSQWGMIIMALALLAVGAVVIMRRQRATA